MTTTTERHDYETKITGEDDPYLGYVGTDGVFHGPMLDDPDAAYDWFGCRHGAPIRRIIGVLGTTPDGRPRGVAVPVDLDAEFFSTYENRVATAVRSLGMIEEHHGPDAVRMARALKHAIAEGDLTEDEAGDAFTRYLTALV